MSDATVVHIGENSPEEIAYKLLKDLMNAEGKTVSRGNLSAGWSSLDRKWLLDTYAECLHAVQGNRVVTGR